ncbi:MAG: type II toxin-antitoxin system RelB/DinJ family antitoxin, partial [Acidaminococcaceae bacterium]|nr:type II toxin-antitoxin system RelB/DinJ family antitoxin [Acidaminococcaceae bacterium]
FRCDDALKTQTAELYEELGLDLPSAFRLFMKRSLQVRGLPFPVCEEVKRPRAVEEMSAAEFSAMLERGYQQSLRGEGVPADEVFAQLEKKYGSNIYNRCGNCK